MSEELRQYDAIGRFGGEEFVAVLSGVDTGTAVRISERIRERVALLEVSLYGEPAPTMLGLSASIGVACYPEHGTEFEDLLRSADAALYVAKAAGRNRVQLSDFSNI